MRPNDVQWQIKFKQLIVLTMFAEWPTEHVPGTPPLAFCVRHDACLL